MKRLILLIALLLLMICALVSCKHTHEFGEWETIKSATCTENGEKVRYCDCGEKQSEAINATGHNFNEIKCNLCGEYNPTYYSKGLEFSLYEDGSSYIVYCGTCTEKDVVIPSIYNDLPVSGIGDNAFDCCASLTSVVIPDSITSIGNWAFFFCDSLTSIDIPDSVTDIGDHAFDGCASLTSVVIPDSITSIGNWAFFFCDSLTSIVIPDSVTDIGDNAFDCCTSLTSVVIPDSVTSIGNHAFSSCKSLISIVISNSITSIGEFTFSGCSSLTSIIIPDGVTSIGSWAFSDCESLTCIVIPDSVTDIGISAFHNFNLVSYVYYTGSEEEWKKISVGYGNEDFAYANMRYNYIP